MVIDVFKEEDIQVKKFKGANYSFGEEGDSEIQNKITFEYFLLKICFW